MESACAIIRRMACIATHDDDFFLSGAWFACNEQLALMLVQAIKNKKTF